jgi:integrase
VVVAFQRLEQLPGDRRELQTWTAEQVRRFLETVHGERLGAAWRVAALTGMRRGEVLGLRWADTDLDGG